jgi:hypothetical protein
MAEEDWEKYAVSSEESSNESDEWSQYETSSSETFTDEPEKSKPTIAGEAMKIAGQGASGLAFDLPNIGNKPISELIAGQVGANLEKGYMMGLDRMDIAKRILLAGPSGVITKEVAQETLHTKMGFPVPPEPETRIGKILGLGANYIGQAIAYGKASEVSRPSQNLKIPKPNQVTDAINQVDKNVDAMARVNSETLSRENDRIKTTQLFDKIKDNDSVSKLEVQRRTVADEQAVYVQERLAVKASKALGEKFAEEYHAKANGKYLSVEDYEESLSNVLKSKGIIDESGQINQYKNLSPSEQKVLNLYEESKSKTPNDVIQMDVQKIPLTEVDSRLKSVLSRGKQYGSGDHILTELRYEFSDKVAELREVGKKFAQDFKDRNAVWDTFKPFGRRGEADVKTGIGIFENLAHENPANVYPQNQRMMDFIKKYAGEDPSEPVKKLSGEIKGIKTSAQNKEMQSMFSFDELKSRIQNSEIKALNRAGEMKRSLGNLFELAKKKESELDMKKRIALELVGLTALSEGVKYGAKKAIKGRF